ncbi:O-antigen polymerase [Bacteroides sp.]|uniref:O-antigen polymerase n=1 Tax=Bacteroides sp. TaxID=29523 RepID=UPI0025BFC5BE|nr:O-antigen polymerase [Bacteroides sp.]
MANITYAGYIALFIIFLLLIKLRGKFYLLPTFPLAVICLSFYNFFGHFSVTEVTLKTEILLLISFVVFIWAYSVARRWKYYKVINFINHFVNREKTSSELLVTRKAIYTYIVIVLFYCCFDLWLNSYIYGSLESALTRFYAKRPIIEVPNILITFQGFFLKAITAFIFIFRYYYNYYGKKTFLLYIAVLLLVLIAFPKGSRGATITPIMFILFADLFSKKLFLNFSLIKKAREYIVLCGFIFALFLSLTFIRGVDFEDLSSAVEVLKDLKLDEGAEEFSKHEKDLMIQDLQFTFDSFGERYSFIGLFYTLNSIIVNPIPRFLFSGKPVGFGTLLTEAKFGSGDFSVKHLETLNTGFAVGVAGEGWANSGLIGLIFYSILLGLYSGFFSRLFFVYIKSNNFVALVFALLFFQASFSFIRGDLQSGVIQSIYPIIIMFFIVTIFFRKKRLR